MAQITSEARFFWNLLLIILKTPITLILILFGKKKLEDLAEPFKETLNFIRETKVTYHLIGINISIYVIIMALHFFGIIDTQFISNYFTSKPSDVINFNIIPILGSWFMHANWLHLSGNMLFLFILGRVVEKEFGTAKTLYIYFGSAIISTLANSLIHLYYLNSDPAGLGASGAIAGFASVAMLISPLYVTFLAFALPLPIFIVAWSFLLSDITGILNPGDNIGHIAHLGGFFAITLLVFLLDKKDRKRLWKGLIFNVVTLLIYLILRLYI